MSRELQESLASACIRHFGTPCRIDALQRLTGGATKPTWRFTAVTAAARFDLVLQLSGIRPSPSDDPSRKLARLYGADEVAVFAAAEKAGVKVPRIRFLLQPDDGLGEGVVADFVAGETLGRKIITAPALAAARASLAADCGRQLAAIHKIDAAELPVLAYQGAAEEVERYYAVYDSFDHPQPAMEVAFAWAEKHCPKTASATVVHGDFRNGNLIVDESGLQAVLDWEIAHLGDPLSDLGWLMVRTWRFGGALPVGGFGRREDLITAYEQATGREVDRVSLDWWEAFGSLKWAVMCMMKGQAYLKGAEMDIEQAAIGRRMEEGLYDFFTALFKE